MSSDDYYLMVKVDGKYVPLIRFASFEYTETCKTHQIGNNPSFDTLAEAIDYTQNPRWVSEYGLRFCQCALDVPTPKPVPEEVSKIEQAQRLQEHIEHLHGDLFAAINKQAVWQLKLMQARQIYFEDVAKCAQQFRDTQSEVKAIIDRMVCEFIVYFDTFERESL